MEWLPTLIWGNCCLKHGGIQLPFNYGRSEELITPKYDEEFQDIELQTRLRQRRQDTAIVARANSGTIRRVYKKAKCQLYWSSKK